MGGSRSHYVIAGAFVLLMLGTLLYTLVRLSDWTAETDRYHTVFSNVTGVTEGTQVYYEGYPVGRVAGVDPLRPEDAAAVPGLADAPRVTRFRLDLEVEQGWPLSNTAVAELVAPGFLSAVVVGIDEAAPSTQAAAAPLEPGSYIPGREQESLRDVIRSLGGRADSLARSVESLVAQAEKTITGRVNPTIDDVRALVRTVGEDVPAILKKADAAVGDLNTLVAEARGYTSEGNRQQFEQILTQLNAAAADVSRVTGNANRLIDDARALLADNRPNVDRSLTSFRYVMDALARDIDTINRNLEGASRNMYEFSRQIRKNPGVLLGGTRGSR